MSSNIKRWDYDHLAGGPTEDAEGSYVLHSDHEEEVTRLRAELQNAAKAALDATALACEKEREADALRVKCDELSMLHVAAIQDKSHLEIKYRNACSRADRDQEDAERYRWLRNKANDSYRSAPMVAANPMDRETTRLIHSEELDTAIDAAMGASA
ncbi:hypothetical protein DFO63_4070 [Stenotrophomonas sp. AG209]|uniref:hypothetical protein n=1 Tax=Stenotrophomonas sp. AG209 TaxID=2183909 RepID=UPI000E5AF9A4|nr:hypothetical protein [Stenotrophomonas sp. AG209]RIA19694.1 hypothetical protein DFO63_4070 [Stenotrophomonas sp. AG209]